MERRTVLYTGHVQGVGFRYTVHEIAGRFAVTGYVKNLPDGRVELVMEGDAQILQEMADAIARRMEGNISRATSQPSPATGEFQGFGIRH